MAYPAGPNTANFNRCADWDDVNGNVTTVGTNGGPSAYGTYDQAGNVDEFVYVLSGKLILTEPNGTAHEFTPGQSLVLPVGYTGTWEMQGNYRELVVLMQKNAP